MGHFKVISKKKLSELEIGAVVNESDFSTLTPDGTFVQLEYIEEESKIQPYELKPGIWTIKATLSGMKLEPTSFISEDVLSSFNNTVEIERPIDCFFKNYDKYKQFNIEIPRRAMLLYGPPGLGKTTSINKVCNKYASDGKTAIILWSTDKLDAYNVKEFFKSFHYVGVEKVMLIAEDIGGVEIDQVRMKSDASLLSLLDNKEKTFKMPIFIIATTNFPENFLGNLTNRPGRFDDKVEVKYPDGPARRELLKFFSKGNIEEKELDVIMNAKFKEFSPAHLHEIVIRSAIHEKDFFTVIDEMLYELEHYKKAFVNKAKLGIGISYDDE